MAIYTVLIHRTNLGKEMRHRLNPRLAVGGDASQLQANKFEDKLFLQVPRTFCYVL